MQNQSPCHRKALSVQLNPSRQDLKSHTQTHLFLGLSSYTVFSYSHSTVSTSTIKNTDYSLMTAVICYTYKSIHHSCNYLLYCKHWIRKYWATNPRGDTELGSCKPLVITYSSTWSIQPFFVCFLFKDTLLNMYCRFTSSRLTANGTVTHACRKLI